MRLVRAGGPCRRGTCQAANANAVPRHPCQRVAFRRNGRRAPRVTAIVPRLESTRAAPALTVYAPGGRRLATRRFPPLTVCDFLVQAWLIEKVREPARRDVADVDAAWHLPLACQGTARRCDRKCRPDAGRITCPSPFSIDAEDAEELAISILEGTPVQRTIHLDAWGGDIPAAMLRLRRMTRSQHRAYLRAQRWSRWSKTMCLALDATILLLGLALLGAVAAGVVMAVWPHLGLDGARVPWGPT